MKKNFAFAALATLMLAGCSNEDDNLTPQVDNLKDTPINVNVWVGELATRAGYATDNLPEQFYLKIDNPSDDTYDYDVLMKYENGAWVAYDAADNTTPVQMLWQNSTTNISVTAATYPLTDTELAALAVQADQSIKDAVNASDHLYYNASSIEPSADGISIDFEHMMSKVQLTITLGDEFNYETSPVTDIKFMGTLASRNYDATSTESPWTDIDGTTASDIIPFAGTYTPIIEDETENATAEYEVILVPQELAENTLTVQFAVGERTFKWTSKNAVTLKEGTQYTLRLTAGKDVVNAAFFSASTWNTGNELTGKTE